MLMPFKKMFIKGFDKNNNHGLGDLSGMKRVLVWILIFFTVLSGAGFSEDAKANSGEEGISLFQWLFSTLFCKNDLNTYTIYYYVDGEEYFPYYESKVEAVWDARGQGLIDKEEAEKELRKLSRLSKEEKRSKYRIGDKIISYEPSGRVNMIGSWDQELPEIMDGQNYILNAVYTQAYYLRFTTYDFLLDVDTPFVIYLLEEGTEITEDMIPEPPSASKGYISVWQDIPETMPAYDVSIKSIQIPIDG